MSRTGMPVARSLVIVASQSRSRSLKRRRPSLPRSMAGSRPMRSYQRRVYWDRPHFAAASPMVQVVTIRAYELERALTQMRFGGFRKGTQVKGLGPGWLGGQPSPWRVVSACPVWRNRTFRLGKIVVDSGCVVDPVAYRPPNQPLNPNEPR